MKSSLKLLRRESFYKGLTKKISNIILWEEIINDYFYNLNLILKYQRFIVQVYFIIIRYDNFIIILYILYEFSIIKLFRKLN
jgi:hypothetical protein